MSNGDPELRVGAFGAHVRAVHSRLAALGYEVPASEVEREFFGPGTRQAVRAYQDRQGLTATGEVDETTRTAIETTTASLTTETARGRPATSPKNEGDAPSEPKPIETAGARVRGLGDARIDGATSAYMVEGTVASPDRAGVGGLRVEIIDRNVGQDVTLFDGVTDEVGHYEARFAPKPHRDRRKEQLDLQARAYTGDTFLGESDVRYNATDHETLDVLLPADSPVLPSEHETLTTALATHLDGRLADLRETAQQPDITYLANKTGWDARAVALAALADQFSQHRTDGGDGEGIHPAFYYALFRAGLPADQDTLYQADVQTVGSIWKQALEQGVIPRSLAEELPRAEQSFARLSAARALDAKALTGTSSLKEMLNLALGDDAQRQRQFSDIYTRERGDTAKFWESVRQSFGDETANRLQLDGQLGYLTLNNAPLIGRLHETEGHAPLSSTLDLARRGYYRADKWSELADGAVPEQIPGETPEEKRANYAELLAAQVRLSFPTAVVADMVSSGELPLTDVVDVRDGVHTFLSEHQGKFEIGMQPIEQYVARNNLGDQIAESVKDQIKRLQRVYQITATDQAMTVLLKNNLDSAYKIVRYDEEEFVQSFKDELGGEEQARLTYIKSRLVHNAVLNIASSYLTARNAPALGSDTAALMVNPGTNGGAPAAANASDVVAYPTLEGLFGSMDFCACDHCRSILSPAAYLVDLLLFIDRPLNDKENAQAVLLERRPDIAYLPLTCENTNTPLPYIDVVNETLEYYVANNLSLANYTGHDTDGSASAEELLASPRFVNDAAYDALKTKQFPPPLPFHRPLEALRRYYDKFDVPLQEAMEVLRVDDAIERADATSYGWRDILMEQLKLSRAEYALLTDRALTLHELYGFSPATSEADVQASLANVKAYARRVGVTYDELVELLKTKFINPSSGLIPRLERLGVPFVTLKALKEGTVSDAEFDALLPPGLDPAEYGGDVKAWVKDDTNYARIMGLITIEVPSDSSKPCSVDEWELRYANPDETANALHAIDYVRLLRFIRLWKKLELTIEQTDKAIAALYPSDDLPTGANDAADLEHLDSGFLALLPRLGIILQVLKHLKLNLKRDLLGLLACWSPIDTHGDDSLYRTMFHSPALLRQDAAFAEDGYGNVLQDNNQKLLAHAEALRGAFRLTGDEFSLIVTDLDFDADTPLTLENISAIYRRGWLARKLRLSVREFLLLTRYAGLDPFTVPDPPNPPLMRLLQLAQALRGAALKPVQALYLIWNQDISGKSTPPDGEITDFARGLRATFASILSEFAVADDPDGAIARARMSLVYGSDATDFFFGLLDSKLSVDVSYSHPQTTLEQPIMDAAAGRIAYDDFRKRLTYSGVLTIETRDALKGVVGVSGQFRTAVDALYTANQAAIAPFFARYPELLPLYGAYVASADPPEKKRTALLTSFLPELKKRRIRQQALTQISAATRTDAAFAAAILDDTAVLHSAGDSTRPALDDVTALQAHGLSAAFFWRPTATGNADSTQDTVPTLAYSAAGDHKLPANPTPADPISGIWSGYLEVPETSFYNVAIETDPGATATLMVGAASVTLAHSDNTWSNQDPISLRAGTLYTLELKVEAVRDALTVRWETTGQGWEVIPARYLYSARLIDHLRTAYIRFLKAISLATGLKLTANETAHVAAAAEYTIAGQAWLNALPVSGSPDSATSQALREVLAALLDFGQLKAALSPNDEQLLAVLNEPAAMLPSGESLLLSLTGWEQASLDALLAHFGKANADLARLETFDRVTDAYVPVKSLGIPSLALLKATTNEPDRETLRDFQSALRARYDQAAWLDVVKPINDELRGLQRDALVADVLQELSGDPASAHVDTPEKLFEYFLMDVEMDPCMETSRIRHALSSVQIFIERCLMNLEPRVAASSIKTNQWAWMKRYRVWEANRKVFLWPENWLEPELRDDQSPFFKETIGELLQSDISEDSAAGALLNYLSKLEEVAKLEPCGIYYAENDPGTADDIAHVVARTAGAHRKYFYRRREYGYWTPWEPIKLDIEDNPVIPVVWKGRLFLFWLRIVKKSPTDPNRLPQPSGPGSTKHLVDSSVGDLTGAAQTTAGASAQVTVEALLCWSEYYNRKWQPPKTSDVNRPTSLGEFDPVGTGAFDRSSLYLAVAPEGDALRVSISGSGRSSFFLLYNTHSLPLRAEDAPLSFLWLWRDPYRYLSPPNGTFSVTYSKGYVQLWWPDSWPKTTLERNVLKDKIRFATIEPRHPLQLPWDAPFLFADSRHVFYVTTAEKLVMVPEYIDYGVRVQPSLRRTVEIPPLVLRRDPRLETLLDKTDTMIKGADAGRIDPSPIERFVTEDAYIRTGIGTTASVRYGERDLGPAGALAPRQRRHE